MKINKNISIHETWFTEPDEWKQIELFPSISIDKYPLHALIGWLNVTIDIHKSE